MKIRKIISTFTGSVRTHCSTSLDDTIVDMSVQCHLLSIQYQIGILLFFGPRLLHTSSNTYIYTYPDQHLKL